MHNAKLEGVTTVRRIFLCVQARRNVSQEMEWEKMDITVVTTTIAPVLADAKTTDVSVTGSLMCSLRDPHCDERPFEDQQFAFLTSI